MPDDDPLIRMLGLKPGDDAYPFIQALATNNVVEVQRHLRGRNLSERFPFGLTPLHVAAQHGAADCVSLLLECGAELEVHDEMGFTPLLYALQAGSRETAERLIRAGALIHYRHTPQNTPEIRAQIRRQHEEITAQARQVEPLLHKLVDLAAGSLGG